MKFRNFYLLALREEIEFDMNVGDVDMPMTVVPIDMTEYGEKVFGRLLNADIDLIISPQTPHGKTTVVSILDDNLEKLGMYFCVAVAGYINLETYDRLFTEVDPYPQTEIVAQQLFKTLLYLGGYRYCVQVDGYSQKIIYAWNVGEAMREAGFLPESRIERSTRKNECRNFA